jgi:signal transduction histidine kinase
MGVPLVARDRVIGMLSLDHSKPNFYEPRHAALAMAFANEAAVAIENAQLYEQAQELAAVEERQRLARELHDSVTQSLYSVTLYAEATARLLENAQGERAQEYLHTLGTTAREALREMRLLIFELRPPLLEQEGLMAALQTRLEAVEGRAGLQVQFEADEDLCLPYDFQKEIYRIAQEALNNVLKHAEANMVTVRLTRKRSLVTLEVVDDGTGFDTRQSRHGGMGLSGMRERVALLNGRLQIDSAPGEGTRVQIKVPCTNVGGER